MASGAAPRQRAAPSSFCYYIERLIVRNVGIHNVRAAAPLQSLRSRPKADDW